MPSRQIPWLRDRRRSHGGLRLVREAPAGQAGAARAVAAKRSRQWTIVSIDIFAPTAVMLWGRAGPEIPRTASSVGRSARDGRSCLRGCDLIQTADEFMNLADQRIEVVGYERPGAGHYPTPLDLDAS